MGKTILATSLASAAALYGSYSAAKAFVPVAGHQSHETSAALRGAPSLNGSELEGMHAESTTGLKHAAIATGGLALAALGSSRTTRVLRRAAAVAEPAVASKEDNAAVEPPPPPPFNPATQLGVTAPLGFFDPLGFAKVGDEEGFLKLRAAELKHGRVAMMAAVGAVFQKIVQFPGYEKVPKGLGAVFSSPGTEGFVALFVVSGALELFFWKEDLSRGVDKVGDYGNPLQLGVGDPLGESVDMKNRELNNGRAAMFAILGIMVAELATGKDALQQLGFS